MAAAKYQLLARTEGHRPGRGGAGAQPEVPVYREALRVAAGPAGTGFKSSRRRLRQRASCTVSLATADHTVTVLIRIIMIARSGLD